MTIEIKKDNHYCGLLFASLADNRGDVLGTAWREPSGKIVLAYRFRYYVDDQAFNSADKKQWYRFEGDTLTLERAEAVLATILEAGRTTGYLSSGRYIVVQGDGDALAKELLNEERPWIHKQTLTPEQAEAMGLPEKEPTL
jgi:hypothetical protein